VLPWTAPIVPDELTLYDIDATKGFEQPARITSTMIVRGLKGLQEYVQYSAVTPAQLLTSLQQNAIGDTWQSIDKAEWRYDPKARASIPTISGLGTPGWEDDGNGERSLALPGGGFSPPERRVRPAGQDQGLPYVNDGEFTCRVTTVRLPSRSKPGQWSWSPAFDQPMYGRSYYRAFELRDGAVRMVRGLRTERLEIDAATAARDNALLPKFDNSMAVLSFDPQGTGSGPASLGPVPTTTEIDWAGDKVPCTAAMAKAPRG
jgi:hypothetical protein